MKAISIDYVAVPKAKGARGKVALFRCLLLTVALLVPIATSSQPGLAQPNSDENHIRTAAYRQLQNYCISRCTMF